jgi:hypothetical protein
MDVISIYENKLATMEEELDRVKKRHFIERSRLLNQPPTLEEEIYSRDSGAADGSLPRALGQQVNVRP